MNKLKRTKENFLNTKILDEDRKIMGDETKPRVDREQACMRIRHKVMNPKKAQEFDPNTFDPVEDDTPEYQIEKRIRETPPDILPTFGMVPKKILEGQMIGMFESKQDLYLLMAYINNKLVKRIEELENKLKKHGINN